jgi:hypothetical protein
MLLSVLIACSPLVSDQGASFSAQAKDLDDLDISPSMYRDGSADGWMVWTYSLKNWGDPIEDPPYFEVLGITPELQEGQDDGIDAQFLQVSGDALYNAGSTNSSALVEVRDGTALVQLLEGMDRYDTETFCLRILIEDSIQPPAVNAYTKNPWFVEEDTGDEEDTGETKDTDQDTGKRDSGE